MKLHALLLPDPDRFSPIGLLIVRAATGFLLMPHGYAKFAGGLDGFAGALSAKGLPAAGLLALCAALSELLGGLCLTLGLLARPAAAVVAFTMVVAWSTMHLADAANIGSARGGVFEYPFLLSMLGLAIAVAGPGKISLDALLFGKKDAR